MTTGRGPGHGVFYEPRGRTRLDARKARRRRIIVWAATIVLLVLVFWLGLAVGRALEDTPRPGGTQRLVRTLEPGTLPQITRTVTVTTVSP